MIKQQVDILIIGGGLTGATLMRALAGKGYSTLLVEANSFADRISPDFDARTIALSPASVRILKKLSLWSLLSKDATPIESIHVSEQGRFGTAFLESDAHNLLGFVVEMQHISRALHHLLDSKKILAPAMLTALDSETGLAAIKQGNKDYQVQATMVVAADGAHSTVRRLSGMDVNVKDYNQQAIIANIGLSRSHANSAYERFTPSGPLAMLPMTNKRASLVWALSPAEATRYMTMNDKDFLKNLQLAFGYRLGRFTKAGKRFVYPLSQAIMLKQTAWPLVFVGNAAHTLHPVAGQGFNLGLRDVATLAQCIIQHGLNPNMLTQYQLLRRYDQQSIARFTDGLVNVFTTPLPGLGLLRGLGLLAVDNIAGLKMALTHHARGFAGIVPDLVCGIELESSEA
ncbi:MAG: FAD-dependent monooxygenase [Legionella sp.]|nr:FAD-dependent monooxygenase [Legionella sp.]